MDDNESAEIKRSYERAERLVTEKVGFLRHLLIYVIVNVLLIAVNLVISRDFLWFLLVLGLWGIGLLAHFIGVFVFRGEWFEQWRRKEIEREMGKLKKHE